MPDVRRALEEMRPLRTMHCVHCGRAFQAIKIHALVCSPRCGQARWRACAMLAGTHRNIGGQFVRIRVLNAD